MADELYRGVIITEKDGKTGRTVGKAYTSVGPAKAWVTNKMKYRYISDYAVEQFIEVTPAEWERLDDKK